MVYIYLYIIQKTNPWFVFLLQLSEAWPFSCWQVYLASTNAGRFQYPEKRWPYGQMRSFASRHMKFIYIYMAYGVEIDSSCVDFSCYFWGSLILVADISYVGVKLISTGKTEMPSWLCHWHSEDASFGMYFLQNASGKFRFSIKKCRSPYKIIQQMWDDFAGCWHPGNGDSVLFHFNTMTMSSNRT